MPENADNPLSFWQELKRRKVIRVIVVYAAASFVILELVSIIAEPFGLPEWTLKIVFVILCIGLIISIILSWIYDITPEGIKKTESAAELEAVEKETQPASDGNWFRRNKVFRRYLVPLFVVVLLVGFYFFKDRIFQNWERVSKEAMEHTEKAILYMKNQADPEIIKQELDLALETDPDYDLALYTYAMIHGQEGDTLLAKKKLHMTVESDSAYSKAWDLLASYAFWQDSFDLVMEYAIKAIDSDPGNIIAAYNLAIQMEDRGFNDQAIELFRKAIQMDSTFTPGYSAMGSLYNKMNRPADAIITLHRSLGISPTSIDNYMVYKNLAEAYFLLEEYEKALDYLEQSKALNADYSETEKCYARYYEAIGEEESSILHWRMYLALETDSMEALNAEHHLDSLRAQLSE